MFTQKVKELDCVILRWILIKSENSGHYITFENQFNLQHLTFESGEVLMCSLPNTKMFVNNIRGGGSNFWSSKVCEGGESREAYAYSLLVHPYFSSKLMITWRKPTFGPLSNWSKTHFWFTFISSNWTNWTTLLDQKLDPPPY